MDKTDRDQTPDKPERDLQLSHLRPESAEIFRKMTNTENKHPLSSSMTLFYPGDDDNDDTDEIPPFQQDSGKTRQRTLLQSGLLNQQSTEVRRFKLSSVKRDIPRQEHSRRSISFPDLSSSNEAPVPASSPRTGERLSKNRLEEKAEPQRTARGDSQSAERIVLDSQSEASVAPMNPLRETIMEVNQLHKGYIKGKNMIPVLNGVDIQVQDGEFLAIVGQSGSGKSTLLHLMGTLDVPDSGTVHFDGQRIDNLPSRRRDYLRNHYIGMIFQFYHLIPEMTMIENVLAPLMVRESLFGYLCRRTSYVSQAKELLDLVGLSHRIKHKPNELSGGEMQRTSIARALITRPRVLLADEPTGNLDSKTTLEIIKLLRSLNREKKLTIIMVTHDMEQARDADRVIRLVDGRVVDDFQTGVL